MTTSARLFVKSIKNTKRHYCPPDGIRVGPREFFREYGLQVRQPIPLPYQHFIANHLAASGFVVRRIGRAFDPAWTLCMRADKGAGRRGRQAVRRGILSALHALGCTQIEMDLLLVDRRRCMFDVCFLYNGGSEGRVLFRGGRASYRVARPHG